MPQFALKDLREVSGGLDHPEGVACGYDGKIYAGGEAGQIYEIKPEGGGFIVRASTGGFILGLALDADDNIYACDMNNANVVKVTPPGEISEYAAGDGEEKIRFPNYPVFDADGNLYVSDSGEWYDEDGRVWKIAPNGDAKIWSTEPNKFANGMALSLDDKYLYVVESSLPGIVKFPINSDGSAGAKELVVEMPDTVPDGLAFDREGNLFISCYRPDRVYVLSPEGALDIWVEDVTGQEVNAPTNIAFAGPELNRLVIASLGGWSLMELPARIPGHKLHYPKIGG